MGELGDMVPKFEKKLRDEAQTKKENKKAKFDELIAAEQSKAMTMKPSTEAYRKGWDRIFGSKRRDSISE